MGSGCALPAIEGVFDQRDFVLFDDTPEARGDTNDDALLVFLDLDDVQARMRTVSIDLRAVRDLPIDEAIEVGDGTWDDPRPAVEVVEGALERQQLDDGGELITTGDDARRATSLSGTLTLEENGAAVAGTFVVDLDDGGYLRGSFRSMH
jgi:hypothetical protein